jgi:hypothetical protein
MTTWRTLLKPVTFRRFASVMRARSYHIDDLVDMFHGQLSENREFFTRVFERRDLAEVVIPYRSVLKFYLQEEKGLELSRTLKKHG